MDDLSLHVLDVAENSVAAGATRLEIVIIEDTAGDTMTLRIADDGRGMDAQAAERATDPFFTTRTTRRVGLGLPLLEEAARATGGSLHLESGPGRGTAVEATFRLGHIDRKPLGNMAETIIALIVRNEALDVSYRHERDGRAISFDTSEIRARLAGESLNRPETLRFIREYVTQEEKSLITSA
jgi:anti-sigma regulatory factor (Ser/Thr protein kinase)